MKNLKKFIINIILFISFFNFDFSLAYCTGKDKRLFKENYEKAKKEKNYEKKIHFLKMARQYCNVHFVNAYYFYLQALKEIENFKNSKNLSNINNARKNLSLAKIECQYITNKNIFDELCEKKVVPLNERLSKISFIDNSTSIDSILKKIKPKGINMSIVNTLIEFEFDSYRITNQGRDLIKKLVLAIKEVSKGISVVSISEEFKIKKMLIVGYTDTTGKASYNQWLSEKRAESIAKELIYKYKIPEYLIEYYGEGENYPICIDGNIQKVNGEVSCTGEEDKEKSRRVEIFIYWK